VSEFGEKINYFEELTRLNDKNKNMLSRDRG